MHVNKKTFSNLVFKITKERLSCLKIWEGHCDIDRTVDGIAKFLRKHFLRSYYNNRAPLILHVSGAWLKEYVTVTDTEIIPNIGVGDARKRKITHERKEYRNLDGFIKFLNITLSQNSDVYFATARQIIEWVKLLPRLEEQRLDIKSLIDKEIFNRTIDDESTDNENKFDGTCNDLMQKKPDFDEEKSFFLDDSHGLKQQNRIVNKLNNSVILDLQSEVLFVNDVFVYLIVGLGVSLLIIILYDKVN